jgi:hypothetical protein
MNPAPQESRPDREGARPHDVQGADPSSIASSITHPERLADTRKRSDEPIASYDELRSVGSWADVKAMYSAKGHAGASDEQYLALVKSDWVLLGQRLVKKALQSPLPAEFPHESVDVGGKKIDVVGIWHTLAAHPDVLVLLRQKFMNYPLLLAEQNLGVMNFGMHSHGLDIPDHFARGVLPVVGEMEKRQLRDVKQWISRKLHFRRVKTSIREVVGEDFLAPTDPAARELGQLQKRVGIQDDTIMTLSRMGLMVPGDRGQELPANIELAYKHEKNLPYTMIQARSAFMAEFLRRWDVAATLKTFDRTFSAEEIAQMSAVKSFVCGQAHQPEVVFFLKYGSKDDRVTARAHRAADALSEQGPSGLIDIHRRNKALFWACETPLSLAKGVGFVHGLDAVLRFFL